MNGAQRRAEMKRLEQIWQDQAAACLSALEQMRSLLPADQSVAVDTARIEEILGAADTTAADRITLPCFAVRA